MIHQFPYCVHVGERGHIWHYPFDNTYRFRCEHDAIQFSLIWDKSPICEECPVYFGMRPVNIFTHRGYSHERRY